MKQNEKFLVYAVTGFLVVILAIAILFGKEVPRQVPSEGQQQPTVMASAPPSLEDVLNRRAAPQPEATPKASETPTGSAERAEADQRAKDQAATVPPAPPTEQPLVANVQLLPPSAAAQVTEKLGLSRRDRDCRVVRARAGDSLGALVQKWCGSTDYLEQARGLNEELTTLRVGQEVWLPWVEDETLLAAFERTHQPVAAPKSEPAVGLLNPVPATGSAGAGAAVPASAAMAPATAPATTPVAAAVRKYTIKTGDSLWKIAEREVGRKQAKSFLDKLLELNPGLESDRIREGQVIEMPAK